MRLVVLRFSALGDVALLVPVLQKLMHSYPDLEITVVSRPFLKPLFDPLAVKFHSADLKGRHKGFWGLQRLAREIKKQYKPDLVVDQHSVLRTHILGFFFKAMGLKFYQLKKDRAGRKALTAYPQKKLRPLAHTTEKYRETFEQAGLGFSFNREKEHRVKYEMQHDCQQLWNKEAATLNLGIAPFAMHRGKHWPLNKMERLLQNLPFNEVKLWFFGGPDEQSELKRLGEKSGKPYQVVAGLFPLNQEIALMQNLQAFLAMDSGNMHLAALAGIPVVSIWGATHPFAGFAPLGGNEKLIVQLSENKLDCRPCSTFGAKPCFRADHACMEWLEVEQVKKTLLTTLTN